MAIVASGKTIIYVIECGEYHKVGITANLTQRLTTMALHNPFPLRCVLHRYVPPGRARRIEAAIHERLANWSLGREWFSAPIEVIRSIVNDIVAQDKIVSGGWSSTWDTYAKRDKVAFVVAHR